MSAEKKEREKLRLEEKIRKMQLWSSSVEESFCERAAERDDLSMDYIWTDEVWASLWLLTNPYMTRIREREQDKVSTEASIKQWEEFMNALGLEDTEGVME